MFARVSHARFPFESRVAGQRIVRQELQPALRQAEGYRGCWLFVSGRPGSGMAAILWDSEEAVDAASVAPAVVVAHGQLFGLGLVIEARQMFDVVACELVDPHR